MSQAMAQFQSGYTVTMSTVFGPKSMTDMIRGIRTNKRTEAKYISQCLQEIKEELKEENHQRKAQAVQKLTYLQMLGYDISWAAFNIVEVMSQPTYTNKRIGYLAAAQCFHDGTEVIMLTTSLLKKALTQSNQYEVGIAISCLACICTPDLARDLAADVVGMLNSARPYIRKKAVLVLYKIFLKFPDALRPSFPRLKERLQDTEPAVVSAAVNVICELARKNPQNYLPLAPTLFKILQSSTNNWMLIKIIKLFAALTPLERRLAKKLVAPLTNIINTTTAMSLLYESIQTCIIGLSDRIPVMRLCIQKLRVLVEDPDQNLKYLGLLALHKIMKVHPKAVAEHRDLAIKCLDDPDVSIRMRALELLTGMITKKNIRDIIKRLMIHMDTAEGPYKDELVQKIITICSQDSYNFVLDFEWYLEVLVSLTRVKGTKHGRLICDQMMDVTIRVEDIRPFAVHQMTQLLRDSQLLMENPNNSSIHEVLYAAVWIVGEFARYTKNHLEIIEAMLQPRVSHLPGHIQSIYMQNVLKLFAVVANNDSESNHAYLDRIIDLLLMRLPVFQQSQHLEVQERACFAMSMIELFTELRKQGRNITGEIVSIFAQPLNPVAPKAQRKVPVPAGLDLDQQINELPEEDSDDDPNYWWDNKHSDSEDEEHGAGYDNFHHDSYHQQGGSTLWESGGTDSDKSGFARIEDRGPYILTGDNRKRNLLEEGDDMPAVASIESLGIQSADPFAKSSSSSRRGGRGRRSSKAVVRKGYEMPENMESSDDDEQRSKSALAKQEGIFANVDLIKPLEAHERLPTLEHRSYSAASAATAVTPKKEEEKKKKREHRHHRRHRREKGDKAGEEKKSGSKHRRSSKDSKRHRKHKKKNDDEIWNIPKKDKKGKKEKKQQPQPSEASSAAALSQAAPPGGGYETVSSPVMSSASSLQAGSNTLTPLPPSSLSVSTSSSDVSETRKKEREERRRRRHHHRSSGSKNKRGKEEEKSDRHRSSSSVDKQEERRRRHSKRDGKAVKAVDEEKEQPKQQIAARKVALFQDLHLKGDCLFHVLTTPSTNEGSEGQQKEWQVKVSLFLTNRRDVPLKKIQVHVGNASTGDAALLAEQSTTSLDGELAARGTAELPLFFSVTNFAAPLKCKSSVTFLKKKEEETTTTEEEQEESATIVFELPIPSTLFMQPVSISVQQFMEVVDPSAHPGTALTLSSAFVDLPNGKLCQKALSLLPAVLGVAIVEEHSTGASFYGRSVAGHHVVVLAKLRTGEQPQQGLSVELKCEDASLAASLVAETASALREKLLD
ncbi:AP-3 complex subunit delta-1 [Balamuthia mandrillaris]